MRPPKKCDFCTSQCLLFCTFSGRVGHFEANFTHQDDFLIAPELKSIRSQRRIVIFWQVQNRNHRHRRDKHAGGICFALPITREKVSGSRKKVSFIFPKMITLPPWAAPASDPDSGASSTEKIVNVKRLFLEIYAY